MVLDINTMIHYDLEMQANTHKVTQCRKHAR